MNHDELTNVCNDYKLELWKVLKKYDFIGKEMLSSVYQYVILTGFLKGIEEGKITVENAVEAVKWSVDIGREILIETHKLKDETKDAE